MSVGNRGNNNENIQDFINENCETVRKLSFAMQLSHPDDYEGGNVQLLDEGGNPYIVPRSAARSFYSTLVHNIEF